MSTQRSSATDPGAGLIAALAERDFRRLAGTLTPEVRMRALIPPGFIELTGAEDAAAKFSAWFGDAEEFELMRSGSDAVADRLHVFYRLRVKKPGNVPRIVEQHLLCVLDADRIDSLDLVCTGFRPMPPPNPRPLAGGSASAVSRDEAIGADLGSPHSMLDTKRRRLKCQVWR
jgi:hypothetical protein